MYGFDTAGSLAEETLDPRQKVPRAILLADPRAHELLADPKRRRKRQMFSPLPGLS